MIPKTKKILKRVMGYLSIISNFMIKSIKKSCLLFYQSKQKENYHFKFSPKIKW